MIPDKKNRINVLFVLLQMEMGGSERLVCNIVSKLDRNIFVPSVAWFYGNRILDEFKQLDVKLYHVPKVNRFDFEAMRNLANIIKQNNINIVNAHHFMSMVYSFYGCKIVNGIKLIYTEHSQWEIDTIPWRWKFIGHYLLKQSDGIIGVNEAVSKRLKSAFRPYLNKLYCIPNGVDIEAFKVDKDRSALRNNLKIAYSERIIGIVANFKTIKNHIFFLKSFKKLVKENKDVKLLLIGRGFEGDSENSEPEIRSYILENGLTQYVMMLGQRSDISDLLSIMDIFCLTSFKEGLPISLIEAMAAGLPVVGTDVEGIRDVIIPDKNGYLVQLDHIEGLKKVLLTLLQDDSLRRRMGQESMVLANNHYSLKSTVSEYQNLFLSLAEK